MWHFREGGAPTEDIAGFAIEARDGEIGTVDKANADEGTAHLLVATGRWIFGKTVMLPAGVINRIDYQHKVVHVNRDMTRSRTRLNTTTHAPETRPTARD